MDWQGICIAQHEMAACGKASVGTQPCCRAAEYKPAASLTDAVNRLATLPQECCQRFHDGELPPTPEALMRSRYSAYVKNNWRCVASSARHAAASLPCRG